MEAPQARTLSTDLRLMHGVGGDSIMRGAAWAPSPTSDITELLYSGDLGSSNVTSLGELS